MAGPVLLGQTATSAAGMAGQGALRVQGDQPSWMSSAMWGNPYTGSAGLFGQSGQGSAGQTMMTASMGLGLAQAFTSTGSAQSSLVKLSPEGKKLEKGVYGAAKAQYQSDVIPQNLAASYIGRIKKETGGRQRTAQAMLQGAGGPSGARGVLREMGARVDDITSPAEWKAATRRERFENARNMLMGIRNMELQTGILKAQSQFAGEQMTQMRQARMGQALGDVGMYAAMMKYPVPYGR